MVMVMWLVMSVAATVSVLIATVMTGTVIGMMMVIRSVVDLSKKFHEFIRLLSLGLFPSGT